jgi:hypothetical protein
MIGLTALMDTLDTLDTLDTRGITVCKLKAFQCWHLYGRSLHKRGKPACI